MSFVIRQLGDEIGLGQRLKALRGMANRTLGEMEKATKIRRSFLSAFEENAYDRLPEPIYARPLLRTYVRALGGDETYFLERFDIERGTCDFVDRARLPIRRTKTWQLFVSHRWLKILLGFILIASLLVYLGLELNTILTPPNLEITQPTDGFVTTEAVIHVQGMTEARAKVTINGQSVLLNPDGSFDREIPLERGVNLLTLEAAKRYSRIATVYRRVIYEPTK